MALLGLHVFTTMNRELDKVMALTDVEIVTLAKAIAFYVAMLDAAEDDPFEDPEAQDQMIEFLKLTIRRLTEEYQKKVNELL